MELNVVYQTINKHSECGYVYTITKWTYYVSYRYEGLTGGIKLCLMLRRTLLLIAIATGRNRMR